MYIWLGLRPRTTASALCGLTTRLRTIKDRALGMHASAASSVATRGVRVPTGAPLGNTSSSVTPPARRRG